VTVFICHTDVKLFLYEVHSYKDRLTAVGRPKHSENYNANF